MACPKFRNFKSVQTRQKFWSQLSKVPNAKVKVNKVHCNLTKAKLYSKTFHEISLVS